jgi:uncharacterized protein
MSTEQAVPARSALREPMFWVVWGLPAVVVVAGFLTLGIAIRAGGADASIDVVQRMAQVQQTDLSADRAAEQQGLGASLALREGRIVLQMLGGAGDTDRLNLQFEHPTASSQDRVIALTREGEAWVAEVALPDAASWHLTLTPGDRRWRLDGRLDAQSGIAILKPRFGHG